LSSYVPESISLTFTPQELASRPLFDLIERAIEHLHALYRLDRYAFEIDLVRSARGIDRGHLLRASREMATRHQRRDA
jgi:GntR family transcriptional regulator